MRAIVVLLTISPLLSLGQMPKQHRIWLPFKNMIGKWFGTFERQPGKGTYECSYKIVLNNKFVGVNKLEVYWKAVLKRVL